jgi:hypothetical protein
MGIGGKYWEARITTILPLSHDQFPGFMMVFDGFNWEYHQK